MATLRIPSPREPHHDRLPGAGTPAPAIHEPATRTYRLPLRPGLLGVRHRTCRTPGCTRRGADLWPCLTTCPTCHQPTHAVRRWLR